MWTGQLEPSDVVRTSFLGIEKDSKLRHLKAQHKPLSYFKFVWLAAFRWGAGATTGLLVSMPAGLLTGADR